MTSWHPFSEGLSLHVADRISADDAARQEATARAILARLSERPGVVLADEVGTGKTFVALAVAAAVACSDRRRPVVVMVPSTLKEKWPRDCGVFAEQCAGPKLRARLRWRSADNGVQFLKLLDERGPDRPALIFLTHGAMGRALTDGWVRLAIIQRALHRRRDTRLRNAVARCAAALVEVKSRIWRQPGLCEELLRSRLDAWGEVMRRRDFDPGEGGEPVPGIVARALERFDASAVYAALDAHIPRNQTERYEERLARARAVLRAALKALWGKCLEQLRFRLPLLILDEAHHLKNAHTQLASLFQSPEAADDADQITRGPLGGVFERMLFLTATPFQLGHHELCSVLERFGGIAWKCAAAPPCGREAFRGEVATVRERLDAAQESALVLDAAWGQLNAEDLTLDGHFYPDSAEWWQALPAASLRTAAAARVLAAFESTRARMRAAEAALRPWVLRHLKPRTLPEPWPGRPRRVRLAGAGILDDTPGAAADGLPVSGEATLPFLLAARATVCAPDSRPVFAEGLASSYEAFLHTRRQAPPLDTDTVSPTPATLDDTSLWYLDRIEEVLPTGDLAASAAHPKIAATAERVLQAWRGREKVLVFCHFIQTGRTLRRVISERMRATILAQAAARLRCPRSEAEPELERLGTRFFDSDSPARRRCDELADRLLAAHPALDPHRDTLLDAVRRFLRTPSFLVRYFPLRRGSLDAAAVEVAFRRPDATGLTLEALLGDFFDFLDRRCTGSEREALLAAMHAMQTGGITALGDDELQGETHAALLANVRLVNGATRPETRQRLMLTFNSPFFPEVLIASSVMAEGVDLHRYCRLVIHHDLDWNPSTLEQRTGRVDRIGAKAERCGEPIRVYLPFVAETQDEKMYRVVTDRERWFSVVMGEQFQTGARHTDALARRIPFPEAAARELAFRLEANDGRSKTTDQQPAGAGSASAITASQSVEVPTRKSTDFARDIPT
jgi:superfamily II DNA or RNA helicase